MKEEEKKKKKNPDASLDQFRRVAIRRALIDAVEDFVEKNPQRGYKSIADFVQEAVRLRMDEVIRLYGSGECPER